MRVFFVCTILVFCCLAIGCKGMAYRSPTDSMKPTITYDDMCVANPLTFDANDIKRFDIVVFNPNEEQRKRANDENVRYMMRVIGLPNERIEIKNNHLFINDKLIDEPFEKIISVEDFKKDFPPIVIPKDEYFLLGDNRPNSEDSRYWQKATINKKHIYSQIVEIKKDYYKSN